MKVCIIGGGPAGLLTGLRLTQNNIDVTLYEEHKEIEEGISCAAHQTQCLSPLNLGSLRISPQTWYLRSPQSMEGNLSDLLVALHVQIVPDFENVTSGEFAAAFHVQSASRVEKSLWDSLAAFHVEISPGILKSFFWGRSAAVHVRNCPGIQT